MPLAGHEHARFATAVVPQPERSALSQLHVMPRRDPRLEPRSATFQMKLAARSSQLAVLIAMAAAPLFAQTPPFDVEAGFRFLDLKGNSDMYRTQINERSGFLIRSFTMAGNEGTFADFYRIDASDLGVGPAGSLRVDFGKASLYRFTLAYRQSNAFSAIPTFALGQHTYDRDRRMIDGDFELDKWSKITPFIGFSWNKY